MSTLYDVLGVPRDASQEAIRVAFRNAAKACHPDLHAGDPTTEQQFRDLIAAYELLKSPQQRALYDQYLAHNERYFWSIPRARNRPLTVPTVAGVVSAGVIAAVVWLSLSNSQEPSLPPQAPQQTLQITAGPVSQAADRQAATEDSGIGHNGDGGRASERAVAASDSRAPDDELPQSASNQPSTAGHTEPQAPSDKERALADYEAAIRIDPNNPALFRDRGILWRRYGDLDRALLDFDRAVRMGFSDAAAYNERGLVWYEKNSLDRAIADFNQALKINPNLVDALINRGNALRRKGDLDHAIADFDEAIRIDPNADAARHNGALARSGTGGFAPATNDDAKERGLPSNSAAHVAAPPLP